MEEEQQQFDKDDYSGLDGQNGENFDQQDNSEQNVEDGGDQAMETGGETQGSTQDEEDGNEDDRKLFVGGLSWETTTKDLREYFEKFGEVTSCTLKTDLETRQSRGFGFVVFKEVDGVKKVLEVKEHKLHGRTIDPKPANPRQGIKKIFVGRLDPGVPEDEVKEYFGTFGTIAKIDFPFDKMKEQRRAFCFIEFESDTAVKKILDQATHKLGGQEVDVKKATPNSQQGGGGPGGRGGRGGRGWSGGAPGRGGRGRGGGGWNQGGNWNQGGYGSGYGSGYGNYGGYGQAGYGYGQYGGYGGYGSDYYGGYGQGGWGGYDQGYGYGSYDGNSSYGKTQKRGHSGGYHPYNR